MSVTVTKTFTLTDIHLSTRELMREVGLLVRERVVRRARQGVSATGSPFASYSRGYAAQKAKALGGVSSVNLTVSGEMLNRLAVTDVTESSVTVGY